MLIFPPRSTVRGGYGRGGKRRFITPVLDADPQWQSPAYRDLKWSSTRSLVFGLFKKSPLKKLEAEHNALLTKEFHVQRNGDVRAYSSLTAEAEAVREKIEALKAEEGS